MPLTQAFNLVGLEPPTWIQSSRMFYRKILKQMVVDGREWDPPASYSQYLAPENLPTSLPQVPPCLPTGHTGPPRGTSSKAATQRVTPRTLVPPPDSLSPHHVNTEEMESHVTQHTQREEQ